MDGSGNRKEKVASDSKISGYVWTGALNTLPLSLVIN